MLDKEIIDKITRDMNSSDSYKAICAELDLAFLKYLEEIIRWDCGGRDLDSSWNV